MSGSGAVPAGVRDPGDGPGGRAPIGREPAGLQTAIRRYIVERGLRPGDRLPSEAELAAALGNSRLIVREALRALDAVGILESRAGSGWFVRPFDVAAAARI